MVSVIVQERHIVNVCTFINRCEHKVTVNLLVSKSRFVPTKSFTIPRLELLSCLLLPELLNLVLEAVREEVNVTSMYC